MLQRHLKSGGAPVAACAGFDFDAASAYLEGALGGTQRGGYESHLAGCATCRRHLIELSRLAHAAPHAETQPAPVLDQTPAWVRWREVVAGWFDLSARNLKWQMAGVAGVALVTLIAALGVPSWRRSAENAVAISADTASLAAPAAESQALPSPTPELVANNEPTGVAAASGEHQQTRSQAPVPLPSVAPKDGDPNVAVAPPTGSPKLDSVQLQSGPFRFEDPTRRAAQAIVQDNKQTGRQDQALRPFAAQEVADSAVRGAPSQSSEAGQQQGQQHAPGLAGQSQVATRITAPPGINPMGPETEKEKSESSSRSQPDKAQPEKSVLAKAVDIAGKIIIPVKGPDPKDARSLADGGKPTPKPGAARTKAKTKGQDDESSAPLKRTIRDKKFVLWCDINMWIDEAYKEETMQFRQTRLKRGSEEYEAVLAKEPQLKEFFDRLGSILIVWKNKIYRVR